MGVVGPAMGMGAVLSGRRSVLLSGATASIAVAYWSMLSWVVVVAGSVHGSGSLGLISGRTVVTYLVVSAGSSPSLLSRLVAMVASACVVGWSCGRFASVVSVRPGAEPSVVCALPGGPGRSWSGHI